MKQLTKSEIESIIDELTPEKELKELTKYPIRLEHVLEWVHENIEYAGWDKKIKLLKLWESACVDYHIPLDERKYFTKSLQEIVEASGYEECWIPCKGITGTKNEVGGGERKSEQLKDKNAAALLNFIGELQLKK